MRGESFKQYWLRMGSEYSYVASDEAERVWDDAQAAVIANTSTNSAIVKCPFYKHAFNGCPIFSGDCMPVACKLQRVLHQ